jgi:hypothetical protein
MEMNTLAARVERLEEMLGIPMLDNLKSGSAHTEGVHLNLTTEEPSISELKKEELVLCMV